MKRRALRHRSAAFLSLVGALVLHTSACATRDPERRATPAPLGETSSTTSEISEVSEIARRLRPVDDWTAAWALRQRVTIRWESGEASFEAVLEKRPGRLRLVGLGPMQTPGFVLTLDAKGLDVVNRTGRPMPFAPEFIVADVQRVFYPWALARKDCADCALDLAPIRVEETGRAGAPRRRTFEIVDRPEAGRIEIELAPLRDGLAVTPHARVTNGWLGYSIDVETLEATPIEIAR